MNNNLRTEGAAYHEDAIVLSNTLIIIAIVLTVLALISVAILVATITKMIAIPVHQVMYASERMNQGDLSVANTITYEAEDELTAARARKAAADLDPRETLSVLEVPVVGRIAAGTPILAEQNIEDSFPVPSRYVTGGANHFMLTVRGDSMIEVGIFSGDYILVQQQNTARNGDIVVAMVDGFESEATVKTFYKENGHIRLQPENSTMSPIIVSDVKILGLVKGVFRYFN